MEKYRDEDGAHVARKALSKGGDCGSLTPLKEFQVDRCSGG